jgi:hypothetical protein
MESIGDEVTNAITDVLTEMVRTGEEADDAALNGLWKSGDGRERAAATRGLRRVVKEIAGLERGDLDSTSDPDEAIAELIETAQETYGHLTAAPSEEKPAPARQLADKIRAAAASPDGIDSRRRAAKVERQRRSELVDLLKGAGKSGGVDGRDLDALHLRADITAEEREQWRRDVVAAGKRVSRLYDSGNQSHSRQLAEELGARLADELAPTGQNRDPLRDVEDGRALANAIISRGRGA